MISFSTPHLHLKNKKGPLCLRLGTHGKNIYLGNTPNKKIMHMNNFKAYFNFFLIKVRLKIQFLPYYRTSRDRGKK